MIKENHAENVEQVFARMIKNSSKIFHEIHGLFPITRFDGPTDSSID